MASWITHGSYSSHHPGATGGSGDLRYGPQTTASWDRLEAWKGDDPRRLQRFRALGDGLAASLPAHEPGVLVDDSEHHHVHHGHIGAQNAGMLDSQFALNTAATSSYSRHANYASLLQPSLTEGQPLIFETQGERGEAYKVPVGMGGAVAQEPRSVAQLYGARATLINRSNPEDADVLISGPADSHTEPWTTTQLGALGLGTYAAYSILAR